MVAAGATVADLQTAALFALGERLGIAVAACRGRRRAPRAEPPRTALDAALLALGAAPRGAGALERGAGAARWTVGAARAQLGELVDEVVEPILERLEAPESERSRCSSRSTSEPEAMLSAPIALRWATSRARRRPAPGPARR